MLNCRDIEHALAGYVDGDAGTAERGRVEDHLRVCPRCQVRATRERTARELINARRDELRGCAPEALRQRCAAARHRAGPLPAAPLPTRRPWAPLMLAASLVLASGTYVLFGTGTSVETYGAQLAVDHIKCFQFPPAPRGVDADTAGRAWQGNYGWPLRVAASAPSEGLELLGVRRCASTRGRVAHMLYRWRGQPLSVYVLNAMVDDAATTGGGEDAHDLVRRFGEQEVIWSEKGRTYAVVARAPVPELQRVAHYVRRRIE